MILFVLKTLSIIGSPIVQLNWAFVPMKYSPHVEETSGVIDCPIAPPMIRRLNKISNAGFILNNFLLFHTAKIVESRRYDMLMRYRLIRLHSSIKKTAHTHF